MLKSSVAVFSYCVIFRRDGLSSNHFK